MSGSEGGPFRARLIDFRLDEDTGELVPVYGYICGQTLCGERHQARWVDVIPAGEPGESIDVYASASECRKREPYTAIEYVAKSCNPPFGVSQIVKVTFTIFGPHLACFDDDCPDTELVWNGSSAWVGTLPMVTGSLTLTLTCPSPPTTPWFTLTISGSCVSSPYPIPAIVSCVHPFTAGGGAPVLFLQACCDNEPQGGSATSLTFRITGYTLYRYLARAVDIVSWSSGGFRTVYAFAECCPDPDDCPVEEDCCGCDVSPRQWTFTVSGVTTRTPPVGAPCTMCADWNTTWVITYLGLITCRWEADHPGICTPGPPWILSCDAPGGVWRLTTSNFAGVASYELSIAAWECFGPNTMIRTSDGHGGCKDFPATLTLTAV
jgi:hypothetical protein